MFRRFVPASALLFAVLPSVFSLEVSDGEKLFALRIKPLFAQKCMACHGNEPEEIKSEFDMRTRQSLISGGEIFEDEVVIPGKGAMSYLYRLSARLEEDLEMPPRKRTS